LGATTRSTSGANRSGTPYVKAMVVLNFKSLHSCRTYGSATHMRTEHLA
jgi:hypothetical protein